MKRKNDFFNLKRVSQYRKNAKQRRPVNLNLIQLPTTDFMTEVNQTTTEI